MGVQKKTSAKGEKRGRAGRHSADGDRPIRQVPGVEAERAAGGAQPAVKEGFGGGGGGARLAVGGEGADRGAEKGPAGAVRKALEHRSQGGLRRAVVQLESEWGACAGVSVSSAGNTTTWLSCAVPENRRWSGMSCAGGERSCGTMRRD